MVFWSVYLEFGAVFFVFKVLCSGVCLGTLGCVFGILECAFEILGIIFCIRDCVFWSVSLRGVYLEFGGMKLVYEGVLWYWVFVFHMWGCVLYFVRVSFQKNPKNQMLSKI